MLPNLFYIEKLYSDYLDNPENVNPRWQSFFKGMELGASFEKKGESEDLALNAYKKYGHRLAQFNPYREMEACPELEPFADYDELQKLYCGRIGYENVDALEPEVLDGETKKRILHELNRAEMFEAFLQMKFTGQKRFSLEGGEALVPMMMEMLSAASRSGVAHTVIGMAHRGRLNVLTHVMGKPYSQMFAEFQPDYVPQEGNFSGDVKYHKGYDGKIGEMDITLAANPSHLEAVDPVVEGMCKALQRTKNALPILIHGDASIAGQGVVYETMQLSKLEGYATGGTIHIVINNQIGFTAVPEESRSTRYCTDLANGFGAPVFHVSGEDPEGCVRVALKALELRAETGCDVFIDLNCFRKYGHNESDEPMFTQPVLYEKIRARETVRPLYRKQLIREGVLSEQEAIAFEERVKGELEQGMNGASSQAAPDDPPKEEASEVGVSAEKLKDLCQKACSYPEGFAVHPKIQKLLDERRALETIDWGTAEILAYATLLDEGKPVRISGQDSCRGTFSHRHASLTDQKTQKRFFPLSHIGKFEAYNSALSEYAVLCFEFGYSLIEREGLTIWEAQYGDFSNGAQVAIDQFVATSEQKWHQTSNLTLMLPHGHEGGGPEHSSARIERFLQLAAQNNMRICNNSTPAQLFHLLREKRQQPLIIFMPKALLRYPPSLSKLEDLTSSTYQKVIDDTVENPEKLIFCSGKVYYDLTEHRQDKPVAIIRIEQLYPFPHEEIKALLTKYKGVKQILWVQEEHQNMGAWTHIHFEFDGEIKYVGRPRSASPAAGYPALHNKELKQLLSEAFDE